MSSLKMTFSLASLVLLMAFIAMPVMAHKADPADVDHNPDADTGNGHSLVKSLAVDGVYLTETNTITATVTFEPMVAAVADSLTTADVNEAVHATDDPAQFTQGTDFTVEIKGEAGMFTTANQNPFNFLRVAETTAPSTGSGAVYTVLISLATGHNADNDGVFRIGIHGDNTYNVADATKNVNVEVTVDSVYPAFPEMGHRGSVAPKAGETFPTSSQLADPFNVLVDLIDDNIIDATKINFTAVPNILMFGDTGWLGGTRYTAEATPKALAAGVPAETAPTSVAITVTVVDEAGNSATLAVTTIMLAPRTASDDDPEGPGDPHVDITVSNIGERSFRIAIDAIPDVVLDIDGKEVEGKNVKFGDINAINMLLVIKDITGREITLELAKEGEPPTPITPISVDNQFIADVTYDGFTVPPLTITVNQDPKKGGLKTSNKDDEWEVSSTTDTSAPVLETIEPTLQNDDTVEFTFTFDKAVPRTGNGAFTAADLTVTGVEELDTDGELDDVLLETVDYTVFTLTLTPKPDADGEIEVVVTLKANSVWIVAGNFVATMSATYMPEVETDAPTVTSIVASAPDMTSGNVTFTITFSEAVTGLTLGDLEIENGSAVDFGGSGAMYTVEVDPDAGKKVSVGFKDTAIVTDTATPANALDVSMVMPGTPHTPEGYVPTVTITAADGTGDDEGEVIFTLNFIEAPMPFSVASLSVTGAAALKVADLKKAAMADEGYVETYTLTVTPNDAATEVKVSIAAGVLGTMTGNLFFEGAEGMHTVIPAGTVAGELPEGDTRDNVTAEADFSLSGTLKAGEFAVFAASANGPTGSTVITNLPNLQRFFAKGGTISLVGPAATKAKTVVITEIMWALNTAEPVNTQADWQWIEVYNTDNANTDGKGTHTPVDADLSKYKLVFTPGTVVPKPADLSDQVSNVDLLGWNVNIGSSGALGASTEAFSPTNLVSMYRNFKYADLTKVHNKDDATKNRNGQLGVIPSGNAAGGWAVSTVNNTYTTNELGSPGEMHFVGRDETTVTAPTFGVIINEVGNNTNDTYDWIELLNTGTAPVTLQKWQISKLTGHDAEEKLVDFPNNDKHRIGAGEILLIVNSDPYRDPDHPLAAGIKINDGQTREEKTGINSRYYVDAGLKLEDGGVYGLLVRNAIDKLKKPTNVIDFTAPSPLSKIEDTSSAYRTRQYPLRGQSAGGGNVFQGDLAEAFAAGKVYWRHKTGAGTADDTWRAAGRTGVGYKRGGSGNGTPGYPNNVVHENQTKLAAASAGAAVTISEIMYDRGGRNNLPQWIELYNSSNTHAVNLNEWKLKIENDSSDVDVRAPAVTIANLGGTIIPPNQTVLIVSYTTGRVSDGSQGGVDFPSNRVISLSGKSELEISEDATKRNYRLLSETGFKLTLIEKGAAANTYVDMVGNLGADPAWDLPMAEEGEARSSIIRGYGPDRTDPRGATGYNMAQDGTMAPSGDGTGSWVLAAKSDLSEVRVNETYYGNPDDIGTPGYRGGGALPVSLSKFRPELLDSGEIVVRWITESELNNAGFNILRSETRDGEFTKLNTKLIAGQGTISERTVYEFADTSAKPNVVYYYQIQDVSLDGKVQTLRQSRIKGYVSPSGKLTTTWGELKALQ